MTLRDRIRQTFVSHTKTQQGLICNPDPLLDAILIEVARWINAEAGDWAEGGGEAEANALRELLQSLK